MSSVAPIPSGPPKPGAVLRWAVFFLSVGLLVFLLLPDFPDTVRGQTLALVLSSALGCVALLLFDLAERAAKASKIERIVYRLRLDGFRREADQLTRAVESYRLFRREDLLDVEVEKAWKAIVESPPRAEVEDPQQSKLKDPQPPKVADRD